MKKEFVIRGKTASGTEEVLNFSGHKKGYAYKMTEFSLYPSTDLHNVQEEMVGSVTAAKTAEDPTNPNFSNEGLIATTMVTTRDSIHGGITENSIVNDTFNITQDIILKVENRTTGTAVNWQCRFKSVKMSGSEEAVTNYKQFLISDE